MLLPSCNSSYISRITASDQGQHSDLRAPVSWNETTLESQHKERVKQVAAPCKSVASGCARAETLLAVSQDYFIFLWSSCTANSFLLRTNKLRFSQRFATVCTASAAGSWSCQICICSPADAWAHFSFICTLGTCIWIRKICIEFSWILQNSRWSLDLAARQLWSPGGYGFLKICHFEPWWEAKCLQIWCFYHHEDALIGRIYSRAHPPLQYICPPGWLPERPQERQVLCLVNT